MCEMNFNFQSSCVCLVIGLSGIDAKVIPKDMFPEDGNRVIDLEICQHGKHEHESSEYTCTEISESISEEPLVVTVIISPESRDLETGSLYSEYHAYRSSPITFEDYFGKSKIQRQFITNVLWFQFKLNLPALLASLFCTYLADQSWFWNAGDDLLNALLLHTFIISIMMLVIPLLIHHKFPQWKPSLRSRSFLDASLQAYQTSLLTFWFTFGFGKVWKSQYNLIDSWRTYPLLCLPAAYFLICCINHGAIIIILRFTQIKIKNLNVFFISFAITLMYLGISVSLVITAILSRGFIWWELAQIIGAGLLAILDGSLLLCNLKKDASKQARKDFMLENQN